MTIKKVDISRILVNNKCRLPVTEFDTAVYVVDIPKASQLILDLINKEQYLVSGSGFTNHNKMSKQRSL